MYNIETDGMEGRIYFTDLGELGKVSTIDLSARYKVEGGAGELLIAMDSLLGTNGNYETAIMLETETSVVASTDNKEECESNHRRAVENLLDGIELPDVDPPLIRLFESLLEDE